MAKPAGRRSAIVAHASPRRSAVKAEKVAAPPFRPCRFEPPSAFRPSPLTRLPVLPSSVNKPWAGSESYKISGLNIVYGWTANPVHSSSLPFCVRFNAAVARRAATLDTGPVASSYPRALFHPLVNKPFPVRTGIAWFGRAEFSGDPSAEVTVAASNTQTGDSRGQLLQSQRCHPRADTRCCTDTSS